MDVKAILLVGAAPPRAGQSEHFGDLPLALTDVLGKPVLAHVIEQLERQGVSAFSVISQADLPTGLRLPRPQRATLTWTHARGEHLWRLAENAFSDHAQSGAEEILVYRIGPYLEIDLDAFLQAHLDSPGHVTRANDASGAPMDLLLITASRRNEGAFLFRHRLRETRSLCGTWTAAGYCSALENVRDLRCLAVDGLLQRNRIRPAGDEVRPGVWVARGAHLHHSARVLAPAYIAAGSRIRANAVITRCSVVERHAHIGRGSVIEDATVLPYTSVGEGLDISRAVVGCYRVVHLERNVEVQISDPRLVAALSPSAAVRAVAGVASLLAFSGILRGLFAPRPAEQPASRPSAVGAPSPALNSSAAFSTSPAPAEASPFTRTWQ